MNKKIRIISLSLLVMGSSSAFATGIPVVDAASAMIQQNLGMSLAGNKAGLGSIRETIESQIKQQRVLNEDADKRAAVRDGRMTTLNRDYEQLPTLQQCAEITQASGKAAASAAARSGGGGSARNVDARRQAVTSAASATVKMIEDRSSLGTCEQEGPGCSGPGKYAGGEWKSEALDGNMNRNSKVMINVSKTTIDPTTGKATTTNTSEAMQLTNYTMPSDQQKVVEKNVYNLVMPLPPVNLSKEALKKNPTYQAMYDALMAKYDAAKTAVLSAAKYKYEPVSMNSDFNTWWSKNKSDYDSKYFPDLKAPDKPSMYEITNYIAFKDFADGAANNIGDGADAAKYANKQLALLNYLQMRNLDAMYDNNRLLAALLSHNLQPITNGSVESLREKMVGK